LKYNLVQNHNIEKLSIGVFAKRFISIKIRSLIITFLLRLI